MSRLIALATLAAVVALASFAIQPSLQADPNDSKEGKVLRHVVLFKFKDEASEAEVQKVVDAFAALPSKIPQVADLEFGTNNSPEGLNDGFTHAFLVSFRSEEDREAYLPHPAHKEFVEILKPHLDKVLVVDYWADK